MGLSKKEHLRTPGAASDTATGRATLLWWMPSKMMCGPCGCGLLLIEKASLGARGLRPMGKRRHSVPANRVCEYAKVVHMDGWVCFFAGTVHPRATLCLSDEPENYLEPLALPVLPAREAPNVRAVRTFGGESIS